MDAAHDNAFDQRRAGAQNRGRDGSNSPRSTKQSSIFSILQRDVLSALQYLGVFRERMSSSVWLVARCAAQAANFENAAGKKFCIRCGRHAMPALHVRTEGSVISP
jgi:hypothetical protein